VPLASSWLLLLLLPLLLLLMLLVDIMSRLAISCTHLKCISCLPADHGRISTAHDELGD
jgi:hypothetical protein